MVTWMAWPHGPEFDHENPRQTGGQLHFPCEFQGEYVYSDDQ